jgi:hypothetical protein
MWTSPPAGTPTDAQALARLQLEDLATDTGHQLRTAHLDEMTRAHLEALQAISKQALEARATVGGS